MAETTPAATGTGDLTALLGQIRDRNEQYIRDLRLTEATVSGEPCGDVRRLLAVVDVVLAFTIETQGDRPADLVLTCTRCYRDVDEDGFGEYGGPVSLADVITRATAHKCSAGTDGKTRSDEESG